MMSDDARIVAAVVAIAALFFVAMVAFTAYCIRSYRRSLDDR